MQQAAAENGEAEDSEAADDEAEDDKTDDDEAKDAFEAEDKAEARTRPNGETTLKSFSGIRNDVRCPPILGGGKTCVIECANQQTAVAQQPRIPLINFVAFDKHL